MDNHSEEEFDGLGAYFCPHEDGYAPLIAYKGQGYTNYKPVFDTPEEAIEYATEWAKDILREIDGKDITFIEYFTYPKSDLDNEEIAQN